MNKQLEALLARIEKLEAAAKLAEEALDMVVSCNYGNDRERTEYREVLAALREALGENNGRTNNTCNEKCNSNFYGDSDLVPVSTKALAEPVQEPAISEVSIICNAYESGFGHGAKNDGLNDGSIFADKRQGEAYELGYAEGIKRSKKEPVKQVPVCTALTDSEREEYEAKIKGLGNALTRQFNAAEELAGRVMELEEALDQKPVQPVKPEWVVNS